MRCLALLLLWPAAAWADPLSIGAALGSAWAAIGAVTVAQALGIVAVASNVFGAAKQRSKARKAAAKQRAQYNASLEDRSVTLLQANPPVRVIYGRSIVGGDIVAMFTSNKTGTRENGSTYTKADALKHLVIVVAAHEVQAINEVFIDGVALGPLDGSGWVTSGEFYKASQPALRTVTVAAGSYLDVSPAVVTVVNSYITSGSGLDATYESSAVTLSLGNTRISNAAASAVTVDYTVANNKSSVRVSKFLGTASQTVDTYLNSVKPTEWTSNHRLRGLAGIVITFDLEEPRFQDGPPQITVDVSGKKVLDTRTSTTAYSENPALIARDFLTSAAGFGVDAADIDTTDCNAAANACDARLSATAHAHAAAFTASAGTEEITCASDRWFSTGDGVRLTTTGTLPGGLATATTYYVIANASRTVFKLASSLANAWAGTAIDITSAGSGTHTVTWYDYAAYTCSGAFSTDGSGKEAVLEDLVETMGGTASYGATWMIQAGAWVASVMSLTDDDLDGQIEIVQAGAGLDAIINGVRGQFIPAGKSTPQDFDPYQNATFLAADGQELWEDVALPFVGNKVRAANLARIKVEQARDGLVIRYPAKLKAWPLQIGDRVAVTSTEYSWSAKTFRVTDWQFGVSTAVILTLQEDAAAIYDLADAVTADPAPNTGLPSPWTVAAVTGAAATSGASTVIKSGTKAMIPRILVEWDAITDPYVAGGGYVDILWKRNDSEWQRMSLPGDSTSAYIVGVDNRDFVVIDIRARNSLGGVGPSTYVGHVVIESAATLEGNLIDATWWRPGAAWEWTTYESSIGETTFVWGADPKGNSQALMKAIAASTSAAAHGGWDFGSLATTPKNAIAVDPNKTYRFLYPVKRTIGTLGNFYAGLATSTNHVCTLNTSTPTSTPWFVSGHTLANGRWHVVVGYVYPAGSTGLSNAGAGVYDMETGELIAAGTNYCWNSTTVETGTFSGIYDAAAGDTCYWAQPVAELFSNEIDGRATYLGVQQVTAGDIVDSSQAVGSTGSPGSSVRVSFAIGPQVVTTATEEIDIVVSGLLVETFWSQALYAKVELWLATSATYGGSRTEVSGTRRKFMHPIDVYTNSTTFPIDLVAQYAPGASSHFYNVEVSLTYINAAGTSVQCGKDYTFDAEWRIVVRKH